MIEKYLVTTNPFALAAALQIVVGAEVGNKINDAYKQIDGLLTEAYKAGVNDSEGPAYDAGYEQGFDRGEERAFDQGYDAGYNAAFTDGYADGVRDARVNPVQADSVIANAAEPNPDQIIMAFHDPDCVICAEQKAMQDDEDRALAEIAAALDANIVR